MKEQAHKKSKHMKRALLAALALDPNASVIKLEILGEPKVTAPSAAA